MEKETACGCNYVPNREQKSSLRMCQCGKGRGCTQPQVKSLPESCIPTGQRVMKEVHGFITWDREMSKM